MQVGYATCNAYYANAKIMMTRPRPTLRGLDWRQKNIGTHRPRGDFFFKLKLTEIADRMADYGVPMVYHHHMGTVIETEREVDLLMANTGPNVNLLIDTGHLTFACGNVEATTRRHGHRVKHVHCKDIRANVYNLSLIHI